MIETSVVDGSATIGVRGTKSDWFWDLSLQGGRNSMDFNIANTLNASLGPTSKTEFFAGTLVGDQVIANVDLSRSFKVGLAGPLNVAFGTELRRQGYQIKAGEPDSYRDGGVRASNGAIAVPGAQVFPGFRPSNAVNASRNNVAFYADLEGDVTSRVRLAAAGRFERYSDFGSNLDAPSPHCSRRWEPRERGSLPTPSTPVRPASISSPNTRRRSMAAPFACSRATTTTGRASGATSSRRRNLPAWATCSTTGWNAGAPNADSPAARLA